MWVKFFANVSRVHRANFDRVNLTGLNAKRFAFIACTIFVAAWLREHAGSEGALCVADPSADDKVVDAVIRELRNQGIPEEKIASFDQLVDTLFIVDSNKSLGLQMGDYANFFLKRHHMGDELAEPFYQTIASLVVDGSLPILFQRLAEP